MKYVVFQSGGKQYRASEGDILEVEHLNATEKNVTFNEILLHVHDATSKIGAPFIDGYSLSAVVLGDVKGEKIRVSKYKAKVRYRRVTGHRQSLTRIQIESINDGESHEKRVSRPAGGAKDAKVDQKEEEKVVEKKPRTTRAKKNE